MEHNQERSRVLRESESDLQQEMIYLTDVTGTLCDLMQCYQLNKKIGF